MSRERRNKPEPVQITAVVIDDIAKNYGDAPALNPL
jgi:hypothetical protein